MSIAPREEVQEKRKDASAGKTAIHIKFKMLSKVIIKRGSVEEHEQGQSLRCLPQRSAPRNVYSTFYKGKLWIIFGWGEEPILMISSSAVVERYITSWNTSLSCFGSLC